MVAVLNACRAQRGSGEMTPQLPVETRLPVEETSTGPAADRRGAPPAR